MTHPPAIGATLWNQSLARGRDATQSARMALKRIVDENPGPQTTAMLLTKTALAISEIDAVLNELEKIGHKAKIASTASD